MFSLSLFAFQFLWLSFHSLSTCLMVCNYFVDEWFLDNLYDAGWSFYHFIFSWESFLINNSFWFQLLIFHFLFGLTIFSNALLCSFCSMNQHPFLLSQITNTQKLSNSRPLILSNHIKIWMPMHCLEKVKHWSMYFQLHIVIIGYL